MYNIKCCCMNLTAFTVYQRTPDIAIVQSREISHGAVQGQYFSNVFVEIRTKFTVSIFDSRY